MDQQVRDYLNNCPVPVTSDAAGSGPGPGPGPGHGTSPGPSGSQPPPGTAGCLGNRILSRNANGTIAMTSQPTNESELQLYRVLQRANLLSYYDTFICQGGDDVQQLCEAGEEEFLEIMALVGMASKPLHVRRLQKALQEWVNNPAMFQAPLVPTIPPNHPSYPINPITTVARTAPLNLSQQSPLPLRPSPPIPILTNNTHSSPSPGAKDVPSPSQLHPQPPQPQPQLHNSLQVQQQQQQQQQHSHVLPQGGGEYGQPGSPMSLTPVLVESQILRLSEAAEMLVKTLPPFDPKPQNNKKKICKDLEYVMNMPEEDPRRMDEIRKYAAIYGRFDCKRKPEKPLTLHEVSVNEAAAQICKHIPALLTRRDELFPLARQVVRDSGYQYSKGHSSLDPTCRSQCYSKSYDEDSCNKRLRLDGSPTAPPDKAQLEEERKKRQDRLEVIGEQLKMLGSQQVELKSALQQAREVQNFAAVSQIQLQLDQVATQQMQLINEQSEMNKQLRRIDRFFCGYRSYGRRSSCSEGDKVDTDDTDSQFSVYSNASSPSVSHDANDSPSHDSNQSLQASDMYSTMKYVSGKKSNAQITKQLVQETLMDEGLRVVKELASQIKEEGDIHIPPTKPEPRPRGRPARLDRDYMVTTAVATGVVHSVNTANSRTTPTPSPVVQNGHSPVSMNGPLDSDSASCPNGMLMSIKTSGANSLLGNSSDGTERSCDGQDGEMNNGSENSLKALLAFSQKGIKQEPSSPTHIMKID